jgi:molybdopterin converting factor small subunit
MVLSQVGVPVGDPGAIVILVNGRQSTYDQILQDGDVVSAFPAMAGGGN